MAPCCSCVLSVTPFYLATPRRRFLLLTRESILPHRQTKAQDSKIPPIHHVGTSILYILPCASYLVQRPGLSSKLLIICLACACTLTAGHSAHIGSKLLQVVSVGASTWPPQPCATLSGSRLRGIIPLADNGVEISLICAREANDRNNEAV